LSYFFKLPITHDATVSPHLSFNAIELTLKVTITNSN